MADYTLKHHVVTLPKSGLNICVAEEGQGSVILFVHGLSANLACWTAVIEELSSSCRCIAIDLPGHGKSQKPIAKYSMTLLTDVIAEVVELLRLEDFILCGHSLGGQVSTRYALRDPKQLKKLILAAPAGFERYSDRDKKALLEFTAKHPAVDLSDSQLVYFSSLNYSDTKHPMVYEDAEYLRKLIDEIGQDKYFDMMYQLVSVLLESPVYEELPLLKVPTLVVYGENDKMIPNKILHPFLTTKGVASDGASRIKDSTYMTIAHAGHMLQREKPQEFVLAVKQFLAT
jgi:pimeloyl-ACP methyl ester carboxylesterase